MEKGTFTITLADGTQLPNIRQNGNCYISGTQLSEGTLSEDNLMQVDIGGEEHENMILVSSWIDPEDNLFWFIIRDRTDEELKEEELNAKIEFLMAMQGVIE